MPANKSWHDYNESLIERGRVLIDLDFIRSSYEEIKNMNKDKVGAPFQYSDNYIQFLAFLQQQIVFPWPVILQHSNLAKIPQFLSVFLDYFVLWKKI